jgi:alcohol dehydrogenase
MKAAIYRNFNDVITIENVKDPRPQNNGVVVEVSATGICRSDWHGWMGHDPDITLPHVPGHELTGTIVEIGKNVNRFRIGDRITVPFVCGCGRCVPCSEGNQQVCDHQSQPGFTHWGSFAEYVALDYADENLVRLPDEIDNVTAASLGCRFITAFRAIVDQGQVKRDQYVAVHGCGGVGLSAIMIAKAYGAKVVAIDIKESILEKSKELGADFTVLSSKDSIVTDKILEISGGGCHISIDALGSTETCINSIQSLRKRGKHIQIGLMTNLHSTPTIPMDKIIANELEVLGSHGMQAHRYPEMLDMIISGRLNPKLLIDRTISLEESIDVLTRMDEFENNGIVVIDRF